MAEIVYAYIIDCLQIEKVFAVLIGRNLIHAVRKPLLNRSG